MENQKLVISPAPHVHGKNDTRRMMGDVLIALLPALVVSVATVPFANAVTLPLLNVAFPSQLIIFEPLPSTVACMIPPLCV